MRYSPKRDAENEFIADLLEGLTKAHRTWGFGLCFLHMRNAQGHPWNHKRVHRIYCELELNLRIKRDMVHLPAAVVQHAGTHAVTIAPELPRQVRRSEIRKA